MLLRFSAANHASIAEMQELTLVATSLKNDSRAPTFDAAGIDTLPCAVIFGANASGKSNLLRALSFLRSAVRRSHIDADPDGGVPRRPFRLDRELSAKPSEFSIDFVINNTRYNFGFEADDTAFVSEWLYAFPSGRRKKLYERTSSSDIEFGRDFKGRNKTIKDFMRKNSLFISTAMQFDHEELKDIYNFISSIRIDMNFNVDISRLHRAFSSEDVDDRAISFLRDIGTGITSCVREGVEVDEKITKINSEIKSIFERLAPNDKVIFDNDSSLKSIINLIHKDRNGDDVSFGVNEESAGTRRLLMIVSAAYKALDLGTVFVVDELDASLHTLACESLVQLFLDRDSNLKGAQLIATTHDTNILQMPDLRRDAIWFCDKASDGSTKIYPLSDVKVRHGDNFERGYLQGRFGAIPFGISRSRG